MKLPITLKLRSLYFIGIISNGLRCLHVSCLGFLASLALSEGGVDVLELTSLRELYHVDELG